MLGVHRRLKIPEEGVRREQFVRNGEPVDLHAFGVLEREWPQVLSRSFDLLPPAVASDLKAVVESLSAW
jgi:hypothetical protein